MIYFDYTATTPIDDEVLEAYVKASKTFFANSTSIHKLGQQSNHMIEVASNTIKDTLSLQSHKLIYTANATEANNMAILGVVNKYRNTKSKIITSKIEHASVFNLYKELEKDFECIYLDVDESGQIDIDELEKTIDKDTILVSLMWVNNIVGSVQNIKRVIEIVNKYPKCKLHVDGVQGLGKVKPDFKFSDIDLFTISAHKLYGPKGIAGLFIKEGLEICPVFFGSSNQYSIKPGTMDVSLVVAMAKTIKKYCGLLDENSKKVKDLFLYLLDKVENNEYLKKRIIINTPNANISYYVFNVSYPGLRGETIVHKFEEKEIYVSTGSACSSKLAKPEKTILAMTKDEKRATSSVRISLSPLCTYEQIDELVKVMCEL